MNCTLTDLYGEMALSTSAMVTIPWRLLRSWDSGAARWPRLIITKRFLWLHPQESKVSEVKRYWVAPRSLWTETEHKQSRKSMVKVVAASDYDALEARLNERPAQQVTAAAGAGVKIE